MANSAQTLNQNPNNQNQQNQSQNSNQSKFEQNKAAQNKADFKNQDIEANNKKKETYEDNCSGGMKGEGNC